MKFDDILNKLKEATKPKPWGELMKEFNEMQDSWKEVKSSMKKIPTPFGKKCPKCDSKNLKVLKPGFIKKWGETSTRAFTLGISKVTPNLNVCRDCGFSWEDR